MIVPIFKLFESGWHETFPLDSLKQGFARAELNNSGTLPGSLVAALKVKFLHSTQHPVLCQLAASGMQLGDLSVSCWVSGRQERELSRLLA